MSRNHESSLDAVLNNRGPEQLDYLEGTIRAERIMGDEAAPDGLSASLVYGQTGDTVDAIGHYDPGMDAPYNVDILSTMATGLPMAKKVPSEANPAALHVVLDMPERLDTLTGNYRAKKIGSFMLALCGRVAEETGSEVFVYHNNGEETGLIFEGQASDMYVAYNVLEGRIQKPPTSQVTQPTLEAALRISQQNSDPDHEALVVVSDFLDGYDELAGKFTWEAPLQRSAEELGDRLWAVRLSSPAQQNIPAGFGSLSADTLANISTDFAEFGTKKHERISTQLENIRALDINTFRNLNPTHPVRMMTKFILGSEQ